MFAEVQNYGSEQRHRFPRVQAQPGIQLIEFPESGQGHIAGTVPTLGNGIEKRAFHREEQRCWPEPRPCRDLGHFRVATSDVHQHLVDLGSKLTKPLFVHEQFIGLSEMNAACKNLRIRGGLAWDGGQCFNCRDWSCFSGIRDRNDGWQGNKQQ